MVDIEIEGDANSQKSQGVPRTFGRHCLNFIFKEGGYK